MSLDNVSHHLDNVSRELSKELLKGALSLADVLLALS